MEVQFAKGFEFRNYKRIKMSLTKNTRRSILRSLGRKIAKKTKLYGRWWEQQHLLDAYHAKRKSKNKMARRSRRINKQRGKK